MQLKSSGICEIEGIYNILFTGVRLSLNNTAFVVGDNVTFNCTATLSNYYNFTYLIVINGTNYTLMSDELATYDAVVLKSSNVTRLLIIRNISQYFNGAKVICQQCSRTFNFIYCLDDSVNMTVSPKTRGKHYRSKSNSLRNIRP